jgi:hypothetical protein
MQYRPPVIEFNREDDAKTRATAYLNAMSGGPMSGFDFDDKQLFDPNSLANEFPEMQEDLELITSTESYVRQLSDLKDRIHANGGINRGMGLELTRLVPDLQGFQPGTFTKDISAVNLEPSLETISAKIAALIAAAIAIIVGLVWKFISWLTRRGGQANSGGKIDYKKGGAAAIEAVEKIREENIKAVEAIEAVPGIFRKSGDLLLELRFPVNKKLDDIRGLNIDKREVQRMTTAFKNKKSSSTYHHGGDHHPQKEYDIGIVASRFLNISLSDKEFAVNRGGSRTAAAALYRGLFEDTNPVFYDLMNGGKMVNVMKQAISVAEVCALQIASNTPRLKELAKNYPDMIKGDHGTTHAFVLNNTVGRLNAIPWRGKKASIMDIAQEVEQLLNDNKKPVKGDFDLVTLSEQALKAAEWIRDDKYYSLNKEFLKSLYKVDDYLDQFKLFAENSVISSTSDQRAGLSAEMYKDIVEYTKELAGAIKLFTLMNQYEDYCRALVRQTYYGLNCGVLLIREWFIKGNQEVPQGVTDIINEIGDNFKEILGHIRPLYTGPM